LSVASIKILLISLLEFFWILVRKLVVGMKLKVFNEEVSCSLWLLSKR